MANLLYRTMLSGGTARTLNGLPSTSLTSGDYGMVNIGGTEYRYIYDGSSEVTDDGILYIAPSDGIGRWIYTPNYYGKAGVPGSDRARRGISGLRFTLNTTDNVNDIDFSAGACKDSRNLADIIVPTGLTKRMDASWQAGDDKGMLLTGSLSADATYDLYALLSDDGTTADFGALEMGYSIATYLPSGYSRYRWLGYVWVGDMTLIPWVWVGHDEVAIQEANALTLFYISSVDTQLSTVSSIANYIESDKALVMFGSKSNSATVTAEIFLINSVGNNADVIGMLGGKNASGWGTDDGQAWADNSKAWSDHGTFFDVSNLYVQSNKTAYLFGRRFKFLR